MVSTSFTSAEMNELMTLVEMNEMFDSDEAEEAIDDVMPLVPAKLAGNTLNGREGLLSAITPVDGTGTGGLDLSLEGQTISTTAVTAMINNMRGNTNRNSTGSAMQVNEGEEGDGSDAEMYERDERGGGGEVTDAEFSMPRGAGGTASRVRGGGMEVFDEEREEGRLGVNNHEPPEDAMDVEQEAEEQALRDGGRDMDEVRETQETVGAGTAESTSGTGTNASSSQRNSEEIVMGVINGQIADRSSANLNLGEEANANWDRTYVPEDGSGNGNGSGSLLNDVSPRSSHEGSRSTRNVSTTGQARTRATLPRTTTIETNVNVNVPPATSAGSQSSPNLATSPQSPTIRGRLIRVPSLTSPYTSSARQNHKRRSITRFGGGGGGAFSENESQSGNTVLGSNFLGTLLGRKRGTSISAHPCSPGGANGDEDGVGVVVGVVPSGSGSGSGSGSSGGSAEGHGTVGEKRKR